MSFQVRFYHQMSLHETSVKVFDFSELAEIPELADKGLWNYYRVEK